MTIKFLFQRLIIIWEEKVYLDKVSGLPVKCETYEKGKLVNEITYEYRKYYDDPENIFNLKGVDLKEVDLHLKDELGVR